MQDILSQVHISDLVEQTNIQDNDVFPLDSSTETLKAKASTLKQYIGGELASNKIDKTEKGAANGVATLDNNGLVPSSQLPSFVDDVLEGTAQNPTQTAAGTYSASGFILTGESTPCTLEEGKTYVDTSSNIQYRWTGTGSNLVSMGSGLVLGETQYSAYAGNKGKANADAISALQSGKVDKVDGKGLSTEDFTTEEKQKLATLVVGENYAELSEAYAIGTRNGVPVTSGDVAYHNNSKYHAEQSQASAILSGSYMNIAGVSAENAELSAIRSGSSANIAGLSAETANDNALKSEGFAVGKQNGTDVGSTSPYYHNNAEYFKDLAEAAAQGMGAADMTGATATTDGTHGLIIQPHAGDQNKVFYGDGTWKYAGDVRRNELVDTVGWTGKNLIAYPYRNSANYDRGVTYTVQSDYGIRANGTCNNQYNSYFDVGVVTVPKGVYTLTGCPSGGSKSTYRLVIMLNSISSTNIVANDTGNGATYTVENDNTNLIIMVMVKYNATVSDKVFYPMLRHADIIDDTYEPYHTSVEAELQGLSDGIYTEIAKCIDYEMTTPSLSAGSVNITLYNPAITAEMKARPYADYSTSGAYADLTVNTYDGSVNLTGTVSAATTITFRLYTPTVISNIPQ